MRSPAVRFLFVMSFLGVLSAAARADSVEDCLRQAQRALENKELDKALDWADKAVAADAKDARGYLLRGSVHEVARRHDKAIADFSKCLELDPKRAAAFDHRGSERFILGQVKEALDDFDAFLRLRPREAPAHWKRGIALYYVGRYAEGRKQFLDGEKAFANDVENAVWHFLCNAKLQGIDKARAEMLKVGPDGRIPMMKVNDLFMGKCEPAGVLAAAEAGDASAELRKAQRFYAQLYLGLYYDATGDKRKALEHVELAAGKYRLGYMGDVAHVHAESLRKEMKKKD